MARLENALNAVIARHDSLRTVFETVRAQGEQLSAVRLTRTVAAAQQISRRVALALADYDAVLTPTLTRPPTPAGHFRALATPEEEFDEQARFNPSPRSTT